MDEGVRMVGQVDGLPADGLSTENGIILASAFRWPLCIDPQGQANKWVKNMEAPAGIEVGKPSDKEFLRAIENSVRFGKPFVMEVHIFTPEMPRVDLERRYTYSHLKCHVLTSNA